MTNVFFLATKRDVAQMILGTIVAIAESLGSPASTIVIGYLFKEVEKLAAGDRTPAQFADKVQTYSYCLLGIAGFTALASTLGYILWMGVGYRMGHHARSRLYKAVIQRSSQWFDEKSNLNGKTMMYYKDIQDLEGAAGVASLEIISMVSGLLAEIAVAFYFSWSVTLVCLAGVPVLIVIGSLFSGPITKRIDNSKSLLDTTSESVSWVLGALQTVKIFQREQFEWLKTNQQFMKLRKIDINYHFMFGIQEGLSRTIVLMVFMQGFYFGSYMVRDHGLSAGNVITVFWSCLNASSLMQSLIGHFLQWNKGVASAGRLHKAFDFDKDAELFDSIGLAPNVFDNMYSHLEELGWKIDNHKNEKQLATTNFRQYDINSTVSSDSYSDKASVDLKGNIQFNEVVFSYPSRPDIVFSDLNMEIAAGGTTFVVGQSGSGKSSLTSLLTKQYNSVAGEICIDGHEIQLLSKLWIENNVYVCEQNPKLFDVSIKENIIIGSRTPALVTMDDIETAISDSCADFVYDLPNGTETIGCENLSGGQQQRIALARARVRDAPIMIFDEVTSALDPELQVEVFSKILKYREGKTTIIITHDLSNIPEGYPVFVISHGIAESFPTMAAVKRSDVFRMNEHLKSRKSMPRMSIHSGLPAELEDYDPRDLSIEGEKRNVTVREEVKVNTSLMLYKMIPNKPLFFLGMVISSLHACVNPVFSFVFSKLVVGILDPTAKKVTMWAMLVLTMAVLDGILSFAKATTSVAAEGWLRKARSTLFDTLLSYPGPKLTSEQVSYFAKLLMSDTEKISEIITQYWPGLLSMVVIGVTGFLWALCTGWKLTLVGIAPLPAFIVLNQSYKVLTTHWNHKREHSRGHVIRLMMDLTSERGFRTLKVQHLDLFFKKTYLEREKKLQNLTKPMLYQVGMGYGLLKCFPYTLECLLLWYGTRLLYNGGYTSQTMVTVFSLLMFTIISIDSLTSIVGGVGNGFEALERLLATLRKLSENIESDRAVTKEISFNGVPKTLLWQTIEMYRVGITFENGTSLLGNFRAKITKGETVAIIGPSGVGKSTIARFLERLETPTTGEIIVDQAWDLQDISIHDVRKNVAMVGQAPLDFFDGTIEENLLYALDPRDSKGGEQVRDVCKACGADDFITKLSEGYESRIKNGLLSGGQLQRLGIARALLRNPKVLIFDESTSALDIDSKELVKKMIIDLRNQRKMIIIIITHQMDVASIADRVIAVR